MLTLREQGEMLRVPWLISHPECPTAFEVVCSTGMIVTATLIPVGRTWHLFGPNKYEFQSAYSGEDMMMVLTKYKLGLEEWMQEISQKSQPADLGACSPL